MKLYTFSGEKLLENWIYKGVICDAWLSQFGEIGVKVWSVRVEQVLIGKSTVKHDGTIIK